MRADLQEAELMQGQLLPEHDIAHAAFSIHGVCLPCRNVAGDWYDYIPLQDGRIAVIVADVAGKGMAAALLMSSTRGILRLLAERVNEPVPLLQRLNQTLLQDFPRSRFVTMAYVLLDPHDRTARIALAGHPPPVLIAETPRLLETGGLPLGLMDAVYVEQQITLTPGTRLVLYSDGVHEAESPEGQEFGYSGIQRHFANPNASADSLLSEIGRFAGGLSLADDATVVTIDARTANP